MSYAKYIVIVVFAAGLILSTGCAYDKTAPEALMARRCGSSPCNESFENQANNAILSSMTVADIHFLPDRSELNFLGRARLTAIAHYLEQYGGKVMVDSCQGGEIVRQERVASVRQFLLGQGLDPERLAIETGLTRGRGQNANEATLFYDNNLLGQEPSSAPSMSQALGLLGGGSGGR